ncbi:MAG: tetratricopeptide repeat protein [Sphingorhabdus sp.]
MARRKKENRFLTTIKAIGLLRILAALAIALIGGWLSLALAISGATRSKSPQVALMFVPGESNALSNRADQLFFANPTKPPAATARLARKALEQQAMNSRALRLLGYGADAKGDRPRALTLVKMAARLSRREPGTQLWLIEHYAQENDTAKTLNHYDILLTTKPDTQALLFPRLSNAIEDAPIRAALIPYLRQDKPWTSGFLWHAINNDKDLSNVVNLILEAKGFPKNKPGNETSREQERSLINRLVSENRFADARRIYALVPGASPALLTNPAFGEHDRDTRFGAMGWRIPDDPNAGGGFIGKKGQGRPALSIFASSATTRPVASRLLYLSPGSYRLAVKFAQFEPGDGGYVQFQMRCPTNEAAAPLWIFGVDPKRGVGQFDVPAGCPVQFLEIVASGGKGQLGLEATISSVAITR